jgi:hypothetical protein
VTVSIIKGSANVLFMRFPGDKKPSKGFISKNKINKLGAVKKFST